MHCLWNIHIRVFTPRDCGHEIYKNVLTFLRSLQFWNTVAWMLSCETVIKIKMNILESMCLAMKPIEDTDNKKGGMAVLFSS